MAEQQHARAFRRDPSQPRDERLGIGEIEPILELDLRPAAEMGQQQHQGLPRPGRRRAQDQLGREASLFRPGADLTHRPLALVGERAVAVLRSRRLRCRLGVPQQIKSIHALIRVRNDIFTASL